MSLLHAIVDNHVVPDGADMLPEVSAFTVVIIENDMKPFDEGGVLDLAISTDDHGRFRQCCLLSDPDTSPPTSTLYDIILIRPVDNPVVAAQHGRACRSPVYWAGAEGAEVG